MKARFLCESCQSEVPFNAEVCPTCGKIFSAVKCPVCGLESEPQTFETGCPRCGYMSPKMNPVGGSGDDRPGRTGGSPARARAGASAAGRSRFESRGKKKKGLPGWTYLLGGLLLSLVFLLFLILLFRP